MAMDTGPLDTASFIASASSAGTSLKPVTPPTGMPVVQCEEEQTPFFAL